MSSMRPFAEFQNQMDRLLQDFSQGFGVHREGGPVLESQPWLPPIEVAETDEDFTVFAEVPGTKAENIDIEVIGNTLTIRGETTEEFEKAKERRNIFRSELKYGKFLRRLTLPGDVQSDKTRAEFHNGILELHIPKAGEGKRKKIKVQAK